MRLKGKLLTPSIDYADGHMIITAKVLQGDCKKIYERLKDHVCSIEISRWTERRSLHANALFHVLVGQIAKAHNPPLSFDRCKNILIGRYGVPELYEGEPATVKTQIPPEKILERDDIHFKPIRGGDQNTWFYRVMKHTRDYSTAEFAKLLDGTIEDAAEMGIDTVTETEKQKALELWGLHIEKRTNRSDG